MSIIEITVIAVAGGIVMLLLKSTGSATGPVVRIAIMLLVISGIAPQARELLSALDSLGFAEGLPEESLKIMVKSFAVLTLSSVAGDICRDNGEVSLAGVVELCGKIASVSLTLPVISSVIAIASSFLQRG